MPQLVKKRRSGWAVLAAGAMVASLLAVGASPAAAITASSMADAFSDRTACLGPATASADFEDVAMGGTHYENIQCLAYYGITTGREGGTQFAPNASVTRSQMSLFLSRMAGKAGVDLDLDDDSDAEFTDLAGIGADRVDAINRLVNAGIMTASGDDTFSPLALVSRAEMALWLVSFMGSFSDDVSLDSDTGLYTIKVGDMVITPHDSFDDSLLSQPIHVHRAISVAFELGITTGYGDLEFKGHRNVSRAEMATFIMRTLAHTNLRPEGLTAQSSGTGDLSIQVSMRAADFVPIDNEPIDVFGALFADAAFNDDGECVRRYVARVLQATSVCEIDAGDFLTGTDGNSNFMATAESVRPQQDTISCGTGGTYTVGSPIGDLANVEFWAWNDEYGETVDDDTDLVEVVHVTPFSRTAGVEPDHTKVSGGLDITKNQHEAEMGDAVPYTVQLHGIGPEGVHVDTGPGDDGAEYNVVISKFRVAYTTTENVDHDGDPDTPEITVRARTDGDDEAAGLQASKDGDQPYLRTPRVLPVNSDGSLTIELTHGDPNRRKNDDDVIVEILITPVEDNDLLIEEGANLDTDDPVNGTDFDAFFDSVVFSDDGVDQTRIVVSAAAMPEYGRAPTAGRSANGFVEVTVINQYGKPVRGQGVHAVSDAGMDSNASPDNTLRFQNWYVTNSSGMHTIGYSYRGGIAVENLSVINTGMPRTVDPLPEDEGQLAPAASARLYWAVDGIQEDSPQAGYGAIGDDEPAEGDWLVIDTAGNTLVVFQAAVTDVQETSRDEAQDAGPHMYYWDARDTFTVGNSRVTMEQFEAVIGGGTDENKVTVATITWDDYDYYVYNDRANWTVTGSCVQDAPPPGDQ